MTTRYLVNLDERRRVTLPAEIVHHRRYRVTEDSDGVIVLSPVTAEALPAEPGEPTAS